MTRSTNKTKSPTEAPFSRRVTSKGTITIPAPIRHQLGWKSGMSVEMKSADGRIFARAIGFKKPAAGDTYATRLNRVGLVLIPAGLRHRLGWDPGARLQLEDGGDRIVVRLRPAIKHAQSTKEGGHHDQQHIN